MVTLVNNPEIEEVGEATIRKFLGRRRHTPQCIDIEGFIRDFLHANIEYAVFAGKDAGKMGFLSDGRYALSVKEKGRIVNRVYPKSTIVIDRSLLREDRSGQRRFTLAHEAAHLLYERMTPLVPGPCFKSESARVYDIVELKKRMDVGETQVDRMASVLLMPRFLMEQTLRDYCFALALPMYGESVMRSRDKLAIQKMADAVGVSYSAFLTRLKELDMIDHRSIEEYLELEMNFAEGAG